MLTRLDQAVAPPRFDGGVGAPQIKAAPNRGWKAAALALGAFAIVEAAGLGYLYLKDPLTFTAAGVTREVETTLVTPAATPAPAAEASPELTEAAKAPPAPPPTTKAAASPVATRATATPIPTTPAPAPTTKAPVIEPTIVPTFTPIPTKTARPTALPTVAPTKTSAPTPGS